MGASKHSGKSLSFLANQFTGQAAHYFAKNTLNAFSSNIIRMLLTQKTSTSLVVLIPHAEGVIGLIGTHGVRRVGYDVYPLLGAMKRTDIVFVWTVSVPHLDS